MKPYKTIAYSSKLTFSFTVMEKKSQEENVMGIYAIFATLSERIHFLIYSDI